MSSLIYYANPGRYYHTFTHIGYMLDNLRTYYAHDLDSFDLDVMRWAITYHDVVYDATAQDNEFQSALVLGKDLKQAQIFNREVIGREAQRLIMLTQHHRPSSTDKLGQIICDLDLAGLASAKYEENSLLIKAEYQWAAIRNPPYTEDLFDKAWAVGRKKFLSEYLNRNNLFSTEVGKLWEERARINMQAELDHINSL